MSFTDGKWHIVANPTVCIAFPGPSRDSTAGVSSVSLWWTSRKADGACCHHCRGKGWGQVKSLISNNIFYAANHNQQMKIILMHPLNSHRYVKLEELLEKSFPLVKMPSIQPIVMQVLKHLPKVWMCSVQWIIIIVVGCQIYFKIAQYTDRLILKLILQI